MTLRVIVQIVPFGDESKAYTIETLNISNVTLLEGLSDTGKDKYVIEHNEYKTYNNYTPRVYHDRSDGALRLVELALKRLDSDW